MLKHFLAVSHTMPPQQGQRYLEWAEKQSGLSGQAMEQRHGVEGSHSEAEHSHM
jgi:hypothetical protein